MTFSHDGTIQPEAYHDKSLFIFPRLIEIDNKRIFFAFIVRSAIKKGKVINQEKIPQRIFSDST
jgi:hypothetical protein